MKKILLFASLLIAWSYPVLANSDVESLLTDNETEFWPEFIEALRFSYDNWLTRFKTVDTFRPYDELTREQAAKIIWVFAEEVMWQSKTSPRNCVFNDIADADTSLKQNIEDACKLGIFKWTSSWDFFPKQALTKAEAIAVIIRMFNQWSLDETWDPWYINYYLEARNLDLTKEKNIYSLERPLTRYEMVLLLYRFHVKYSLLEKLNNNVWLINDDDTIAINSVWDWVVVINSNEFLDEDVDEILVQIEGKYYLLKKSNLISQFDEAYTRYGDVYLIDSIDDREWTYIWVSTFNLVNWVVSDGNIRPTELFDRYFQIDISDIRPFYQLEQLWEWAPSNSSFDVSTNVVTTTVVWNNKNSLCDWLTIQGQCQEIQSCSWRRIACSANEPVYWCIEKNIALDVTCE